MKAVVVLPLYAVVALCGYTALTIFKNSVLQQELNTLKISLSKE